MYCPALSSESWRRDTERFGEILYSGSAELPGLVKIYHIPPNTHGMVYMTVCDSEWNPRGNPRFLDTLVCARYYEIKRDRCVERSPGRIHEATS